MADHPAARRKAATRQKFTLRTLFFVSAAIALPFLLIANFRSAARPDDSLASPVYLLAGVAAVLVSAVIGNALGRTTGMLVTGSIAAFCWILFVAMLSQFSSMLSQQLPVHMAVTILTVIALGAAAYQHREPADDSIHEHLTRLLKVKGDLHSHLPPDRTGDDKLMDGSPNKEDTL